MIDMQVQGLQETQRNMERIATELSGPPMVQAMRDATLMVERDAKKNLVGYRSPDVGGVDTGRLRASIVPEIDVRGKSVQGVVGSNVTYAPFVEFDTAPHWPPLAALETWAQRHGTTAYVVARAIARRGTRGKKYLQKAYETNIDPIIRRFQSAVGGVVNR